MAAMLTVGAALAGFDKVLWSAAPAPGVPGTVVMSHVAPHMDQGFGGELVTLVKYTLTDDVRRTDGINAVLPD